MLLHPFRRNGLRVCLLLMVGLAPLAACLPTDDGTSATQPATGAPVVTPANLVATGGDMRVTLNWTQSVGASGYLVKRSGSADGEFGVLASVTVPPFIDSNVLNGATYHYVVAALGDSSQSGFSTPVSATPLVNPVTGSGGPGPGVGALPAIPANLAGNGGDAEAALTWSAAAGATSYVVKRSLTPGGPYTMVGATTATRYTDIQLVNGTTYYYVVNAVNARGATTNSNEASALPLIPPLAPQSLQASAGNAFVDLSWDASDLAASYVVRRSTRSGGPYGMVGTTVTTTYHDATVTNGTTYYYVVAAANAKGTSANSMQVRATPEYCSDLPQPGTWQDVTPAAAVPAMAVNGTVAASLLIDPFDAWKVWLGTGEQNEEIWQSGDCASTWTRVNAGTGGTGPGSVGEGSQWSMQADFVTPNVLYATAGNAAGGLWKSVDAGNSWTDVLAGSEFGSAAADRAVGNISLDGTDPLHLTVTSQGACAAPYQPSCIAETLDGGLTWRTLAAPESSQQGTGVVIVAGQHWIWCGASMKLTTDAGASWSDVALPDGGNCEAMNTQALRRASNGSYYLGSQNGVLRSADGQSWQRVSGTSGPMEIIALGADRLFAASRSQPLLKSAPLVDDQTWTDLAVPAQLAQGTDGGIPYLAYDEVHGVLYASMLTGGVARIVF